jgi:hypothetical protein
MAAHSHSNVDMSTQDGNHEISHVIGIRPDGSLIRSPDDLPFLPVPKEIVVGNGILRIDQWGFSLRRVSRRFLYWLRDRSDTWRHLDPSKDNREWIQGVFEAVRDEILKEMK